MGSLILGNCELPSNRLRRSCFLCSLYEKVGSLTDCLFRKYERAFSAYEERTGEIHRLASKRTHLNERQDILPVEESNFIDTGVNMNVLWTIDVTIGTPGNIYASQSPLQVTQISKLITKSAVQMDTFTADTFISGVSCLTCYEKKTLRLYP